jgi:hypothetical protein
MVNSPEVFEGLTNRQTAGDGLTGDDSSGGYLWGSARAPNWAKLSSFKSG